jgi:hypothetical protein
MYYRLRQVLILVLLSFMVVACATKPAAPDAERVATAKRFLHSWGAGEMAMTVLRRTMEKKARKQPGMAELVQRAFSDVKGEEFEDMAARVYARHLSQEDLAALAEFTESPSGNHFFRVAVAGRLDGKSKSQMMRQLSADELTAAMRFARSDAFTAMKEELPAINREIAEEARKWGRARMQAYLDRQ